MAFSNGSGFPSFKCLVTFPSGDQMGLTSYRYRMKCNATTLPMDQGQVSVALAHSLHIAKGNLPPDKFSLTFAQEKENGDKMTLYQGATVIRSSPIEQALSLKYYRAMTVKKVVPVRDCSCGDAHDETAEYQPPCWMDGTGDRYKDLDIFYTVVYDRFNLAIVNKALEVLYIKREHVVPAMNQLPKHPDLNITTVVNCVQNTKRPRAAVEEEVEEAEGEEVVAEVVVAANDGIEVELVGPAKAKKNKTEPKKPKKLPIILNH